jgi:hypothetical protein
MSVAAITPCRGDFFATDAAHVPLKEAIYWRDTAKALHCRIWRVEMRHFARAAVRAARIYRGSR